MHVCIDVCICILWSKNNFIIYTVFQNKISLTQNMPLFVVFFICFVVVVLLADVMMHSSMFFINGHMCIYSYMASDIW